MNKAKDYLVKCGIDDRYHLQLMTEDDFPILGGKTVYTSDLMELWAEKENRDMREMLIKTHTALGKKLYFQYTHMDVWDSLSDENKQLYCKSASKAAGIDHAKYLEILKGAG